MKHRMRLVQIVEKEFNFDGPETDDIDELLMAAWHALDEHEVQFIGSVKRERIELAEK